jgi:hypothetical protein
MSKSTADFYNFNKLREEMTSEKINAALTERFPVLTVANASAAVTALNARLGTFASSIGADRDHIARICMANMSYFGIHAGALQRDTAEIISNMISHLPALSCGIIICSNAPASASSHTLPLPAAPILAQVGDKGEGHCAEAARQARISLGKLLRDPACARSRGLP